MVLFMFDFALTGVVRNAIRLANGLVRDGHQVTLLVCREHGRERHAIDGRVRVQVVQTGRVVSGPRRIELAIALPSLRKWLAKERPDIIVSAGNHGHLPMLAASYGLPNVHRMLRISNEPDHAGDGPLMRGLRNLMLRLMVAQADRLLLVSDHLARHPVLAAAVRRDKVSFVPNGVDIDAVKRLAGDACDHPWIANRSTPLVVSMGRLARHKNYATLLRAMALVNEKRATRLLIVGRGDERELQELLALAERLGISDRVDLVGERANPFPYIAGASAFVLPSKWEGCSNALLEALACGVPTVASRTAGNACELLEHGRFGVLVDPANAAEMADAILRQTGDDPCLPGARAQNYEAQEALARACAAIVDGAREDRIPAGPVPHVDGRRRLMPTVVR